MKKPKIDTRYSCVMQKPTRKTQLRSVKPTYSEGANDERDAVLAYIRRRLRCHHPHECAPVELQRIEKWLLGRAKRYNKAKGGLGKKS